MAYRLTISINVVVVREKFIRQLAYPLYTQCECRGWAEDACNYNQLITTWPGVLD